MIKSYVKSEQKEIKIPFNTSFNEKKVSRIDANVVENKTEIVFENVTKKFFNPNAKKPIDNRELASLLDIKTRILEYTLIKLFLLKNQGKDFRITLILDEEKAYISPQDIPEFESLEFYLNNPFVEEKIGFSLYYQFTKDHKNSKKLFLCSNYRAIKVVPDDELGFSCGLPENDSFLMLVTSPYLDDKDNDARSELTQLSDQKQASYDIPFLYSDIVNAVKSYMREIVAKQYPQLERINAEAVESAKNEFPHLTPFIDKGSSDITKTSSTVIKKARMLFEDNKKKIQQKFSKLLVKKEINSDEFEKTVDELSLIAAVELGEYIIYRENIIKALRNAVDDIEQNEEFVHNIFMLKHTSATELDDSKHQLSNLWLFDDKFMTYAYAASDKTVNQIANAIQEKNASYKVANRPDLALFYNRQNGYKDAIIVEFKGLNASKDEKNKSLTELPNDIAIIKRNIEDVKTIWGYIITTIDDDFSFTIENQSGYIPLFASEDEMKGYYRYFDKQNAHIYIVDINTIISDSTARNETFLSILRNKDQDSN